MRANVPLPLFLYPHNLPINRTQKNSKTASLTVGNIMPLGSMPEGTVCSSIEAKVGDRGTFARCSGDYAVLISHDEDKGTSKIRLPSGSKKTVSSDCRAMVGIVAGGGRTDKPMLKAGRAYHK